MEPHTPTSQYWPHYLPRTLIKPNTTLLANLAIAEQRFGARTAIGFLGRDISYTELLQASERFAGWLQSVGVQRGDRVMVYMQNCPQWIIAYYGILRADAVLVPANPMNKADELHKLLVDCQAKVLVCSAELAAVAEVAKQGTAVTQLVTAAYTDYLPEDPVFTEPEWLRASWPLPAGSTPWQEALGASIVATPSQAQPDDLASINYTSGSTGDAKGCMHTHHTLMHTVVGLATWHGHAPGTVFLGVAPMYQIAGFIVSANCAIYVGGTIVPLPRWERRLAMGLIEHYRIHFGGVAPTALIDMLSDPEIDRYDLSSLKRVSFGGASMPDSVWQQVNEKLGLSFIEAYGMTETAATTHINPVDRPKRQCLGIPYFDTQSLVVQPGGTQVCAPGEVGEIIVSGPQLLKGYWNKPEATQESFVEIDGTRYFRTGDIGMVDDEGYFFMTDRVKRMINASGFKVWPAEIENFLYNHPAVKESCVIGTRDGYRGESVKALVVLKAGYADSTTEQDIIDWARARMAAYKYPRVVEFMQELPKSPVGKILWRELQDADAANQAPASSGTVPSSHQGSKA